jgi:hypothetical protein
VGLLSDSDPAVRANATWTFGATGVAAGAPLLLLYSARLLRQR